jgi:UrcA family protein
MNTETATATGSRPKITLLMVLCGIVSAASVGAVSAATSDEVPGISLQYDPQSLATDSGARMVYRQIVAAAERACPEVSTGSLLVSNVTKECRKQLIARTVRQINNPRLVEVYSASSKSG